VLPRNATGDYGEIEAAAWFRRQGYLVSVPWGLGPYDLVVDTGEDMWRVEVKTTTQNGWVKKGCKAWGWTIIVDASKGFDYLYCHTPDIHYFIPKSAIGDKRKGLMVPRYDDTREGTTSKWMQYALPYKPVTT